MVNCGVNNIARNDFKDARPETPCPLICIVLINVTGIGQDLIAIAFCKPDVLGMKYSDSPNIGFEVVAKGLNIRDSVRTLQLSNPITEVTPIPSHYLGQADRRPSDLLTASRVGILAMLCESRSFASLKNPVFCHDLIPWELFCNHERGLSFLDCSRLFSGNHRS